MSNLPASLPVPEVEPAWLLGDPELFPDPDDAIESLEDDEAAERVLRAYQRHSAEIDRLHANADREIERIAAKRDHDAMQVQRRLDRLTDLLTGYMRSKVDRDPKCRTWRLPSGNLRARRTPEKVEILDAPRFTAWALDNCRSDLLNITPAKADVKRAGTATESGEIVTPDGEVLPGVRLAPGEDRFSVELDKGDDQ